MYPEAKQTGLLSLVEKFHPRRIMNIGPAGLDVFGTYLKKNPDTHFDNFSDTRAVMKLDQAERYDLCFISHVLEYMPKAEAEHLIARLRDVHCDKLNVVIPVGVGWSDLTCVWQSNEMLGLGFTRVGEFEYENRTIHIYAFDIEHYKTTPDWLNSNYWANPDMFGKYWW